MKTSNEKMKLWQRQLSSVLPERLHKFPCPRLDVVLSHVPAFVCQKLLRVGQFAGVGRWLGPNTPELKIHPK